MEQVRYRVGVYSCVGSFGSVLVCWPRVVVPAFRYLGQPWLCVEVWIGAFWGMRRCFGVPRFSLVWCIR